MSANAEPLVRLATPEETAAVARVKKKWAIRAHADLQQRLRESGSGNFLIEGLVPARGVTIVVGDSGVGKSPLLYQQGICVAAAVPSLGRQVLQGRVLYLDFENGIGDSEELIARLARHLGLTSVPDSFLVWHFNDCPASFSEHQTLDMIREWASLPGLENKLVILDSLGAFCPEIEDKNSIATRVLQELRKLSRDHSLTVIASHHLRKPSPKPDEGPPPLAKTDPRAWLLQARGPRAIINGSDVRLGVDNAGLLDSNDGEFPEICLVLRGFGRVRGEIGPMYLARVLDEEGSPLGYRLVSSAELLFNPDQKEAYARLPETFTFAEAKRVYGRRDQATKDFLGKCFALGLVRKIERGRYQKCRDDGVSGV